MADELGGQQTKKEKVYQCPECGLHYEDEKMAKQCEAFCKEHNACSLEITQFSIESRQAQKQ